METLLSRVVKCLIMSKVQSILIKETEWQASQKRELLGESTISTY